MHIIIEIFLYLLLIAFILVCICIGPICYKLCCAFSYRLKAHIIEDRSSKQSTSIESESVTLLRDRTPTAYEQEQYV